MTGNGAAGPRVPPPRKALLAASILVGLSATAGSIAFLVWAWPRIPPAGAIPAAPGEKLADGFLLALIVLQRAVFSMRPVEMALYRKLAGCHRALDAFLRGALLVLLALLWVPWNESGLSRSELLLWFARGAFLLGALLHLSATSAVGNDSLLGFDALRRRLLGLPPDPRPEIARIPLKGPHTRVRHPHALAVIIMLASSALFARDRLLIAAGGILWLAASAWAEEARLLRLGGEAYRSYRARTGFLLPRSRGEGEVFVGDLSSRRYANAGTPPGADPP